jgi:hypothetical protein
MENINEANIAKHNAEEVYNATRIGMNKKSSNILTHNSIHYLLQTPKILSAYFHNKTTIIIIKKGLVL